MNNLEIEILKQNLNNIINNANLPVGVSMLIINDIARELQNQYSIAVNKEYNESMESVDDTDSIPMDIKEEE